MPIGDRLAVFQEPHPEWDVADVDLEPHGLCDTLLHSPCGRLGVGKACDITSLEHWESVLYARRYVVHMRCSALIYNSALFISCTVNKVNCGNTSVAITVATPGNNHPLETTIP